MREGGREGGRGREGDTSLGSGAGGRESMSMEGGRDRSVEGGGYEEARRGECGGPGDAGSWETLLSTPL